MVGGRGNELLVYGLPFFNFLYGVLFLRGLLARVRYDLSTVSRNGSCNDTASCSITTDVSFPGEALRLIVCNGHVLSTRFRSLSTLEGR